jgi:putative hydrolase of HD superfamily
VDADAAGKIKLEDGGRTTMENPWGDWSDGRLSGDRLTRQIDFVVETDKLKEVLRRSVLTSGSRRENTAEHSWHISLTAMVLAEYAGEPKPDLGHVLKLLLVHDIVEIDADDTFAYDAEGYADKDEREQRAADRLFGLLPDDQRGTFLALWREFEEGRTAEARFAAAMDRLQPVLLNYCTGGASWRQNGVRRSQVLRRLRPLAESAPRLWTFAQALLARAVERGYLLDDLAQPEEERSICPD